MIFAAALGHLVPYASANVLAAAWAWSRSSGVPDLGKRRLRAGLGGLGQRVEHVGDLVEPAALFSGLGEHVAQRGPEPERTVTDREHRSAHPAARAAAEQIGPGLGGLALTVIERDQLLGAIRADTDDDQQAHVVLGKPDPEVDPVGPHIHVVRPRPGIPERTR